MQSKRLKKGDTVKIISGREKGKTGKVLKVEGDKNRLFVEKLNIVKKHQKPDAKGKGGILEKEAPIAISDVMFFCNKCEAGVKVGYRILEDGKKVRVCKKCHELLDA
ncbi:MAG: 50S ribosomal protein L24 [Deltaproteobacteria bacterium]|nr:50S ribosomal protein L24 [Deltaproteobacteria bacterium]